MDDDFRERMIKAAAHAKIDFTPQSIGTFLGVDRRKAAVWMSGSLPRADKIFQHAKRLGVEPEWYATGLGDMVRRTPPPADLPPHEAELLDHYRQADPRWRLALTLLSNLAVEDQVIAAGDLNVIMARILGMKPQRLRPVSDERMRAILQSSPQGWPPRSPARSQK